MSRAKRAIGILMATIGFAQTAHAVTVDEISNQQNRIEKANLDAKEAEALAKARSAAAQYPGSVTLAGKPNSSDPAVDFVAYSFSQFGKRTCVDILFRGLLFNRCAGGDERIDGWSLVAANAQKAVFAKGKARRTVYLGISLGQAEGVSTEAKIPSAAAKAN